MSRGAARSASESWPIPCATGSHIHFLFYFQFHYRVQYPVSTLTICTNFLTEIVLSVRFEEAPRPILQHTMFALLSPSISRSPARHRGGAIRSL
jgi:hypothetical protein